jgi:EAL and modified HD-GYP domain-containing signal transduction protein
MGMKVPPRAGTGAGAGAEAGLPPSVARQPIFGPGLEVSGYELFFRTDDAGTLMNFDECDLARAAGNHPAFINLTEDFILKGHCDTLPPDRVVLEILEDVRPGPAVLGELRRLSNLGYRIALDDFVFETDQVPLVRLADIVKIDILATERTQVRRLAVGLGRYGVRLLAEKIETEEALRFAMDLGFDFLQGYVLSRPDSDW